MATFIPAVKNQLRNIEEHEISLDSRKNKRELIDEVINAAETNCDDRNLADNNIYSTQRLSRITFYRRSIYLILSEPQSSVTAKIFFYFLVVAILLSNTILIGATLPQWSYHPDYCEFCVENSKIHTDISCVCPPEPLPITDKIQDVCMFFFAIEWILRVACYVPSPSTKSTDNARCVWFRNFLQWSKIFIQPNTIIDALAVFPYYLERYVDIDGLMILRLLRVFRLGLLLRLGRFSSNFQILVRVLAKSLVSFTVLFMGLAFGAAFFGSMVYFCEMGEWKYTEETSPPSYAFMRPTVNGIYEEPTPFKSIPNSFWWYIVTSTTVGYGDYYPTTVAGKVVGVFTMVVGLLVVAFPVMTFCESWATEYEAFKKVNIIDNGTDDVTALVKEVETHTNELIQNKEKCINSEEMSVRSDECKDELLHNIDADFCNGMMEGDVFVTEEEFKALNYHLLKIYEHQREIDKSQEQILNVLVQSGLL